MMDYTVDRLPLNDIAKLRFPDDENARAEFIQQVKEYINNKTFNEGGHYFANESDTENPLVSAGGVHFYFTFLVPTGLNDATQHWLKAQNWVNPKLQKIEKEGLDACLDYESICWLWANGKKLFDEFYNESELQEKIVTAIQNGALRAKVEQEVREFVQTKTKISYIEIIDKSEIRRISKEGYSSFYCLDGSYIRITINNGDFYGWLVRTSQWPLHKDCLLNYWWDEQLLSSDPNEHLEALDCMYAYMSNGKAINWNYWASLEFSSFQAVRLVNYIDPIEWPGDDYKSGKIPSDWLKEMARLEEWLTSRSDTWTLTTLIPALADYSNRVLKPINPPWGMVEAAKKIESISLMVEVERTSTEQVTNQTTTRNKIAKKTKKRIDNLTKAILAACESFGRKPAFNELWNYFQSDKDKTEIISDYKDTHITWQTTKGKIKDTQKESVANRLSRLKYP
jgi:hypothetical protein